jgi:hypothetical protein
MSTIMKIKATAFIVAAGTLLFSCQKEKTAVPQPVLVHSAHHATPPVTIPALEITQSEQLAIPANVDLPANLPDGNSRVATYYAEGVQKYKAQAVGIEPAVTYQWVFVAPQADLYDVTNKLVGTHSAGPVWQLTGNTAEIFGQHFVPARTAPSTGNIDWLLLMPKAGTVPTGIFADVDYIQRIATFGGRAPVNPPTSLAETAEVPYTAIYRFSKIN